MIVAFVGKKGCGKTTIAKYLHDMFSFEILSFASPLKESAKIIFGLTDDQVYGSKKDVVDETLGITPRKILQVMGTELFQFDIHKHIPNIRIPNRNLWVMNMRKRIRNINEYYQIVIDDLRFPHEAKMIKEEGGYIVRIYRDDQNGDDKHASEKEMEEIKHDFYLVNNGTLNDLRSKVIKLLAAIFKYHMRKK